MKKPFTLVAVLLFLASASCVADSRISVIDFVVHSDNNQFKYVGKGISEMIGVELRKSVGITIIEREKRSALLEEMEFSVSDLADEAMQTKIGKMLSADYVLYGEIVDMGDSMLITPRLIKVETGEVVWSGMLSEKINRYEYIAAFFTKSVLDYFHVKVVESTNRKLETKKEKDAEAVIAFSNAVDLYDKKDTAAAKAELDKAKEIDPTNEAVNLYIQKLAGLSPKFRVELERYAPSTNPATLGFLERDEIYWWFSMPVTGLSKEDQSDYGGGLYGHEVSMSGRGGYMFPIGDSIGLDIEFIYSHQDNSVNFPFPITDYNGVSTVRTQSAPTNVGGCAGIGWKLFEQVSIGGMFHLFNHGNLMSNLSDPGMIIEGTYFAAGGGFVFQAFDKQLLVDAQAVYTNQAELYADVDVGASTGNIVKGEAPLLVDATVTGSLLEKTLFLACKGVSEIYLDARGGLFQRIIPIVEYWPLDFLSMRAGYELSLFNQQGKSGMGHGFLAGASLKIWDFSINANFSYRDRPIHLLPGYQINQSFILFGVTYSPGFMKR